VPITESSSADVRLRFAAMRVDDRGRAAMGVLGDEVRRSGPKGWAAPLMRGSPIERGALEACLGAATIVDLVDAGLAAHAGDQVVLATTISDFGGVLTAIPKYPWGDETVYLGPDSAHLIEAALRLAPRGERAADLGTGTGLLAAVLTARYRAVVATDLAHSVVGAADLTLALNRRPPGHAAAACVADVGSGLRPDSFDLVVANAPWVPLAADHTDPREMFAHGGEFGVELPERFVTDGAALLRAGGVAITLALDMELEGHRRPLRSVCDRLAEAGFVVESLPTPFNRERPQLLEAMQERQPALTAATHVAVIVARPRQGDDRRRSLMVAADALRRRWRG